MKARRVLAWATSLLLGTVVLAMVAGWTFRASLGPPVHDLAPDAVYAPHGVVATSQPLASQAGLQILQRGGNAVDAAVTAAAVLNVVEPYMTGLGGDMFAILWSEREQQLVGINGSGRAGALMTREALGGNVPDTGPESVTVPGALSGWAALLEEHGTITLADALAPAVALAEGGFPVSKTTASEWALFADDLKSHPGARGTYLIDGERAPLAGEWFSNPDLARTMKAVAREGPDLLYGGTLGQTIAQHVQELGGFLTTEDFARHRAEWVEPLSVPFKGHRIWELPPNGQGIAVLEMLRLLEPYDLASMGHNAPSYLHHLIEAKKLAYSDLEHFVGDPEFMTVEPERLLADDFIASRRRQLSPARALAHAAPDRALTQSETTYLAAADDQGNMISFINSLAGPFGSGIVVPGTGFALQNRGAGFSVKEERANTAAPGRRPFHTIIPGFVTKAGPDGKQRPWLSFGIVGGAQQPQAHVQVLLNILLFDMDVQQALDAPRFRHWRASSVTFESSIPQSTIDKLRAMGHRTQDPLMEVGSILSVGGNMGLIFGGGQAIMRSDRGYVAGSDSRRDGLAAAY
jgi:gamma-glutamyltranspeptidase/glutathione hydrolase